MKSELKQSVVRQTKGLLGLMSRVDVWELDQEKNATVSASLLSGPASRKVCIITTPVQVK